MLSYMGWCTFTRLAGILTIVYVAGAACAPFPLDQRASTAPAVAGDGGAPAIRSAQKTRVPANGPVSRKDQVVSKRAELSDEAARGRVPSSLVPDASDTPYTSDDPALRLPDSEDIPSLAEPHHRQDGNYVTDEIRLAQRAAEEQAASGPVENLVARIPLQDVYFGFDSVAIDAVGRAALATNAHFVKDVPVRRVVVEGHCDDRGSSAYNLVLGEKRALAIQNYFTELGVDPSHIETVSYGEERPFCLDSKEACYRQNRRAHIWIEAEATAETLSRLSASGLDPR